MSNHDENGTRGKRKTTPSFPICSDQFQRQKPRPLIEDNGETEMLEGKPQLLRYSNFGRKLKVHCSFPNIIKLQKSNHIAFRCSEK